MNKIILNWLLLATMSFCINGCATNKPIEIEPAGFVEGGKNGFVFPFVLVGKSMNKFDDYSVFAEYNNGIKYWCGFVFGIILFIIVFVFFLLVFGAFQRAIRDH